MSKDNVHITVRERGKLVTRRDGHNVWVTAGNQYMSQLISCSSFDPFTPERNDRLRWAGLGIGGVGQHDPAADTGIWATNYPAGSDPNATDGHRYNRDYPIFPEITTLERPVKVRGSADGYSIPDPSDEWLINFTFPVHENKSSAGLHAIVKATNGDVLLGAVYPYMPLSEIGLFTSASDINIPFNPLVAYFSFDTIQMNPTSEIEIIWSVRF